MTNAQIVTALGKLDREGRLALAQVMQTTERNIYRWQEQPPNNPHVRKALIEALGGKR